YNTSHFFGFFSSINNDAIRDAKLYKSGIPAKYGGRISSVLDMNVKEGNKKQFDYNGGISPISGRLTLEGPIIKDKISFLISGRSTYSNWILKKLPDPKINKSRASFDDLTGKLSYNVNSNNTISLTGYYSSDKFNFNSGENYTYENKAFAFKWKHILSQKLFYVFTGTYSGYSYVLDDKTLNYDNRTRFGIQNFAIKNDFTYSFNKEHKLEAGLDFDKTDLYPAFRIPLSEESNILPKTIDPEHSILPVLYLNETWDPIDKLSLSAGLRYSEYFLLGPKTIFLYSSDEPRIASYITDTLKVGKNKIVKNYHGLDFRFSGRYSINNNFSLKASYNRIYQYFYILSNTTTISPTDIWKSSDYHLSPEIGNQYSLGVYWNMGNNKLNCSIEGYYKTINNLIEYKGGANLLLNEHIETDLINSFGKSYGVEFLLEKTIGKLNGWISYAYSRSFSRTEGRFMDEIINGGNYFPTNFDKPHSVSVVCNYTFNRRISASGDFTYSSGHPVTYPVGVYQIYDINRVLYVDRNQYRIPDYLRVDASITIEGNLKVRKIIHGSWVFSVYNLLGRENVYSEFFKTDLNNKVHSYKVSIFNRPIFTVTYNFKFYSI
ncbi:MAG TPA: TonB-dependent receptor, partial [Ignavibacteria bacterium]